MGFVFPFFFLSHKMLNAKRKELIITAVNVIILSEVKIALLRFQFLPRFSLLFYFFYFSPFYWAEFVAQRERAQQDF